LRRQPLPPQLLDAAADRLEIVGCAGPRHHSLRSGHYHAAAALANRLILAHPAPRADGAGAGGDGNGYSLRQGARGRTGRGSEAMHLMYFTEQPMSAYPSDIGLATGYTALMFSNKYYDPAAGSRLYNEYLEHYILCDELGFDGIMLNEHHNAPFCMQSKANIFAAILAAATKNVKIVMLGNPLPLAENPVRLSEELAMIDMISKGRLVSGFVRGGGQEQLATGVNPAFNRERFEEAHDLIVAAWTREGPFRWEGTHYQHRVVNPWAVPLQKPYPRVWIPGVISPETVVWAAQHGYPYIALNTPVERTKQIWQIYDEAAAGAGFKGGPDYHGLLKQIHVAETEEKAIQNAAQFRWMQGEFTGLAHPVWSTPSGYGSPVNRRAFVEFASGRATNPRGRPSLEKQMEELMIIAGTPQQVIAKLRILLEETRPGILGLWGNDGTVTHEDAKTCIRLMGQEVLPAVREIAKELDLKSPFETNQPVSVDYIPGRQRREPVRAAAE
jgi:alkanesulfonate monooxygenase SsuD/methylene tetrahydromethanopterin reductase-like flavin-dependent oxidoreductase (luciferase family)